jgi:tetratricopeptide (TPR) repeat protein
MSMSRVRAARHNVFVLVAYLTAAAIGCSGAPEKKQLLARTDTLMLQQRYREAINESRRVLEIDDNDSRANRQLGLAHLKLGELTQAYHFLLRAQALNPSDVSVRLSLGSIYSIEGELDQVREQADRAIQKDSTSVAATLLFSGAARTSDEVDQAIEKLEAAAPRAGSDVRPKLALGVLYLRKRDTSSASNLFREAASNDPKSVEAQAVLAAFAAQSRNAAAEQRQTAVTTPAAAASNDHVKASEFFLLVEQRAEAERTLREILDNDPVHLPARRLLAELTLVDGGAAQALNLVAPILAKDSNDVDALVQRGRARLASGQIDSATRDFERAFHAAPGLAPIHYQLGVARISQASATGPKTQRDSLLSRARSELDEATKLAKNYPEAVLRLAELNIQGGGARSAITDLEDFLAANPESIRGQELLGNALAASGRNAEATEAFQRVTRIAPRNPEAHYQAGLSFLNGRKNVEAAQEFESAVALAPGYAEPMTQLVMMDLTAGQIDSAVARVEKQVQLAPQSATLYDLLGWVHAVRKENDAAEAALLKSIQLDPTIVDAHMRLAELYNASGRFDQAAMHAEEAAKLDPKNGRVLLALGVAYQQKGDAAKARTAYEAAMAADPRSAGAANNLAYLMSQQGDQEGAYAFAARAQQMAPRDPHVADTFGWILYKRGDYDRALKLLKDAATNLPESPSVQYHFGMTAQKLGDVASAQAALTKAVNSSFSFPERDEARKALMQLK